MHINLPTIRGLLQASERACAYLGPNTGLRRGAEKTLRQMCRHRHKCVELVGELHVRDEILHHAYSMLCEMAERSELLGKRYDDVQVDDERRAADCAGTLGAGTEPEPRATNNRPGEWCGGWAAAVGRRKSGAVRAGHGELAAGRLDCQAARPPRFWFDGCDSGGQPWPDASH